MVDTKLSGLGAAGVLNGSELVYLASGGVSKLSTVDALRDYLRGSLYPQVNTFADLPAASASGLIYVVLTTTGLIGFRKLAGMYRDSGTWDYLGLYGRSAVEIANVPAGTVAATDVQGAINELDGDIQAHIGSGGAHHADVVAAGAAGFMSGADKAKLDGIAAGATAYTDEMARDALGTALVAGSGITITPNDGADTITIAATGGGSGDVVGPGSATDLAIARFDGATGKLLQNSVGTLSDDGVIRSATDSGNNPVGVPLVNIGKLAADYVLTSTTSAQKAFDFSTNGALTLPPGTYGFEIMLEITGMSATSGNFQLQMLGAGTATCDRWMWDWLGIDNNNAMNVASTPTGGGSNGPNTPASALSAQVGTAARLRGGGTVRVTAGGTMITSVALVTAAAATVKVGSYVLFKKYAESGDTTLGNFT